MIAYLNGSVGKDTDWVDDCLKNSQLIFPPVVLSELLSDPILSLEVRKILWAIPLLAITAGFWERAGLLRSRLLKKNLKARLADTLIAQSCLDHEVCLITRDADFRHFRNLSRLVTFGLP
jgi:predicted nucleic acid-binding protein